jgi:cytochrome P450
LRYKAHELIGADTFLIVTPFGSSLEVASPEVTKQVTSRRNDFPKPVEVYSVLDIYGKSVISSEGTAWRLHRKITSAPFSERNNALVWKEALYQSQQMMKVWNGNVIEDVSADTMKLALHIIARAGFGVPVEWPGVKPDRAEGFDASSMQSVVGTSSKTVPPGHRLSFQDALDKLLHNFILNMIFPNWALKYSPIPAMHGAYIAWLEWGQYQQELIAKRLEDFRSGDGDAVVDLLGVLVKAASPTGEKDQNLTLTHSEIMGNTFIFIVAGHETTAHTLAYAIMALATSYESQDLLHEDLDRLLPKSDPSTWTYETLVPVLWNSNLGAVLHETLRLWPPTTQIPKWTHTEQTILYEGRTCTVPANTLVSLAVPAIHRSPKSWPTAPQGQTGGQSLDSFVPSRWLWHRNGATAEIAPPSKAQPDQDQVDEIIPASTVITDAAATFFKPPPGAYLPFSDGHRACLGRRFAIVEMVATLAILFREHSVELVIDSFLDKAQGDEEVAWRAARAQSLWSTDQGSASIITLGVHKGGVPLRLVKRGAERFKKYEVKKSSSTLD